MACTSQFQTGFYGKIARAIKVELPKSGYNKTYLKTSNTDNPRYGETGTYKPKHSVYMPVAKLITPALPKSGYNKNYMKSSNKTQPYFVTPRTKESALLELGVEGSMGEFGGFSIAQFG